MLYQPLLDAKYWVKGPEYLKKPTDFKHTRMDNKWQSLRQVFFALNNKWKKKSKQLRK